MQRWAALTVATKSALHLAFFLSPEMVTLGSFSTPQNFVFSDIKKKYSENIETLCESILLEYLFILMLFSHFSID